VRDGFLQPRVRMGLEEAEPLTVEGERPVIGFRRQKGSPFGPWRRGAAVERPVEHLGTSAREIHGSRVDRREERLDCAPDRRLRVQKDVAFGVDVEFGATGRREAPSVEFVDDVSKRAGGIVRDGGDLQAGHKHPNLTGELAGRLDSQLRGDERTVLVDEMPRLVTERATESGESTEGLLEGRPGEPARARRLWRTQLPPRQRHETKLMAATQRPDGETRPITVLAGEDPPRRPGEPGQRSSADRDTAVAARPRPLPRHRARRRNSDVSAAGCELRDSGDRGGGLFGA